MAAPRCKTRSGSALRKPKPTADASLPPRSGFVQRWGINGPEQQRVQNARFSRIDRGGNTFWNCDNLALGPLQALVMLPLHLS